jgi:hypothetical protein
MFNEEFEFDEVTSFLTSITNFSKVRKQREIISSENLKSDLLTPRLVGEEC